jgi:hypothetical protein
LKKIASAAVALLLTSACASNYVGTPYTATAQPLSRVALADDTLPDDVIAYQAASTMSNFGLLGGLIDAGVQASRRDAVNDALETIAYDPEPAFEAYLIGELAEHGITATLATGPEREKREFVIDYPQAGADVQAYFDLVVHNFGYVQAGGNEWRPAASAEVRLVERATGATLMENFIAYNIPDARAGVITLPPNAEFRFANREDMVTHPERLAAGMDDALHKVADTAVSLLR